MIRVSHDVKFYGSITMRLTRKHKHQGGVCFLNQLIEEDKETQTQKVSDFLVSVRSID